MICNRNNNCSFGKYVGYKNLLGNDRLGLVDIGARGGLQSTWMQLQKSLTVIGFDPDMEECERINKLFKARGIDFTVYPYAIDDRTGQGKFNISRFPHSSGFISADLKFTGRLSEITHKNLEIVKTVELKTVTLDKFIEKEVIPPVNFLKIDTEGSEHRVLKGASRLVETKDLLGVESEFWTGPIKKSDNFAALHDTLSKHGFYLFDINIGRYPRNVFPRGFLTKNGESGKTEIFRPQPYGQILTGDVVYLRDPVWEHMNGAGRFVWNEQTVLKMAMIYEIYCLYDCAIELLMFYNNNFDSELDITPLLNFLTPEIKGLGKLNYKEYVQSSLELPWREREIFEPYWEE